MGLIQGRYEAAAAAGQKGMGEASSLIQENVVYIKEWEGGMVLCVHRSCRSHMQGEGNGVGMVEAIN